MPTRHSQMFRSGVARRQWTVDTGHTTVKEQRLTRVSERLETIADWGVFVCLEWLTLDRMTSVTGLYADCPDAGLYRFTHVQMLNSIRRCRNTEAPLPITFGITITKMYNLCPPVLPKTSFRWTRLNTFFFTSSSVKRDAKSKNPSFLSIVRDGYWNKRNRGGGKGPRNAFIE